MKFESEVGIMRWLKAHSPIPVPDIHTVARRSNSASELKTFMATEKMPGDRILNVFGDLPYPMPAKERVVLSYAEHALAMLRLIGPQGAGWHSQRSSRWCSECDFKNHGQRAVLCQKGLRLPGKSLRMLSLSRNGNPSLRVHRQSSTAWLKHFLEYIRA
ncbi:hypothetical protein LXA43DRAFT_284352 [Ganoderma leucocontextum]|nr:hypothetical protein LXA43DRAFT_284352 [Ganoderma leucocontextum]